MNIDILETASKYTELSLLESRKSTDRPSYYYKGKCPLVDCKDNQDKKLYEMIKKINPDYIRKEFTEESTPFTVSPKRNQFYCFKCQRGGNTIDLICKMENITPEECIRKFSEVSDE